VGRAIHLLGTPHVEHDGAPVDGPRGHKVWGLLTYLLRSPVPPTREHVATLLFPEADDPLGALRWTLSALRRQLGPGVDVVGDPVSVRLPSTTLVDLDVLARGSWTDAVALPGLGRELLEGLAFRSSPGFDLWLSNERRHVVGTTCGVLHEAALAELARGDLAPAVDHASDLVRLSPYDENAHVLLVRCLRAAGDLDAAKHQVALATGLFRRELGVEPTPALRAAAVALPPVPGHASSRPAVLARIEAAESALAVGAREAGVHGMWEALATARAGADPELVARALVGLGAALVHSARGTDEEGVAALHEGAVLAEQIGRDDIAARAWREVGWVQFLRAQYEQAERSLERVDRLTGAGEREVVWAQLLRGTCRHDLGDHPAAARLLTAALASSEAIDDGLLLAYALTHLGRFHLLRGEMDDAVRLLDRALALCSARHLLAFVPWPESFRAEADLMAGDVAAAEARLQHAFAIGCQVGDPCWEGVALRGLGLAASARGDDARAVELLLEAPRRCRRLPDTYLWIEAYALDALCTVTVAQGAEAAPLWTDRFERVAARRGIRELVAHAMLHRARLGDPGALDAARSIAEQVGSPALDRLVAAAG
jgi:DNA-binding SARP family transcriptional activator